MAEVITKVKINVKEGTIELEGNEQFVSKYLEEFKANITSKSTNSSNVPAPEYSNDSKKVSNKPKSARKGISLSPIPIDLKSSKPNLRDFYKSKNPSTNQEKITLFVYYINKNLEITNVLPGHIVSCYKEVGDRLPLNIPQMFKDITHLKSWIEPSGEAGSVKTTISGDNLIEHDLPRTKKE